MSHPGQHYGERKRAVPPTKQWWTINGQVLMDALVQCHRGTSPSLMYLELIANSDTEDVKGDQDED